MGGNDGDGLDSKGYYEALSDHTFYAWSNGFSVCNDSPYWINSIDDNEWENGGTG
jgi:hypothetical protein